MAKRGEPAVKEYFNIPREHMLLLVSSVAHGLSERGMLIKHLSQQLQDMCDGETDVRDVVDKAISVMATEYPEQIVDYRHTLRKRLILPSTEEKEQHRHRNKLVEVTNCSTQQLGNFFSLQNCVLITFSKPHV